MCYMFSGIYTRAGNMYTLGEEVVHERIIERFQLRDKNDNFFRWEIIPIEKGGYLQPLTENHWLFRIRSKEVPSWFEPEIENHCWKFFKTWYKSQEGKKFQKKVKKYLAAGNTFSDRIERVYKIVVQVNV